MALRWGTDDALRRRESCQWVLIFLVVVPMCCYFGWVWGTLPNTRHQRVPLMAGGSQTDPPPEGLGLLNLQQQYLRSLSARPVAYNPELAKIFKSINAALLLSQFLHWQGIADKDESRDGWFWKTRDQLYEEIGMGRYEFEGTRKILRELDILEEQLRGAPAKNYYRINVEKFDQFILSLTDVQLAENSQLVGGKPTNKLGENQPTSRRKTSQLYIEAESTSESTPESTSLFGDFKLTDPQIKRALERKIS